MPTYITIIALYDKVKLLRLLYLGCFKLNCIFPQQKFYIDAKTHTHTHRSVRLYLNGPKAILRDAIVARETKQGNYRRRKQTKQKHNGKREIINIWAVTT